MKQKAAKTKKLVIKPKPKSGKPELPSRHLNAASIISQHPQCRLIVQWLCEGSSCASIARYLAQHGMIGQSVTTFTDYLLSFKRCYPELLEDNPRVSLDSIVSAHKPPLDVESELHRMLRLQKIRLAIGVENELTSRKLSRDGHKEMSVTHDYLQTLAKMEGKISGAGQPVSSSLHTYPPEVQADLINIKRQDEGRERLRELTMQFIASFKQTEVVST